MNSIYRTKALFAISLFSLCLFNGSVRADIVPEQDFKERVEVPEEESTRASAGDFSQSSTTTDTSCWGARLSPGVTVWFFDEEHDEVGPALYLDLWNTDYPLNFRVGVEGRHLSLVQDNAQSFAEFIDKAPHVTYIRIPFALEYVLHLDSRADLFLGGGPDIVHTANDNSDTTVGGHLGARIGYNFDEHFGVSVEGGYMWADIDSDGGDVDFDGAYVSPLLTYTF